MWIQLLREFQKANDLEARSPQLKFEMFVWHNRIYFNRWDGVSDVPSGSGRLAQRGLECRLFRAFAGLAAGQ